MLESLDISKTRVEAVQNSLYNIKPVPRRRTVSLKKAAQSYGFTLKTDYVHKVHYIDKVVAASPADQAGLKSLDRVFSVNNVSLTARDHKFAVQLIEKYENCVYLEILVT